MSGCFQGSNKRAKHINAAGRRRTTILFFGMWGFIVLVSAVDGYLALRHRHLMLEMELNPMARRLIHWNDGNLWCLLTAKFAGTVLVSAALLVIRRRRAQLAMVLTSALAILQLLLLSFFALA
jgi:hypothetical protein